MPCPYLESQVVDTISRIMPLSIYFNPFTDAQQHCIRQVKQFPFFGFQNAEEPVPHK